MFLAPLSCRPWEDLLCKHHVREQKCWRTFSLSALNELPFLLPASLAKSFGSVLPCFPICCQSAPESFSVFYFSSQTHLPALSRALREAHIQVVGPQPQSMLSFPKQQRFALFSDHLSLMHVFMEGGRWFLSEFGLFTKTMQDTHTQRSGKGKDLLGIIRNKIFVLYRSE